MSINTIIQSKQQLTELTRALREQLTPECLVTILTDNVVTDPALQQKLAQAVGRKSQKPLKTRAADALAAKVLGFNNAHEMFAHYNNQLLYNEYVVHWTHKYGEDTLFFYAPEGVDLTRVDLAALAHIDWEPRDIMERLSEPERATTNLTESHQEIAKGMRNVLGKDQFSGFSIDVSMTTPFDLPSSAAFIDYVDETVLDIESDNFEYADNELLSNTDRFRTFPVSVNECDTRANFLRHLISRLLNSQGISLQHALRSLSDKHLNNPETTAFQTGDYTLNVAPSGRWVTLSESDTSQVIGLAGTTISEHDCRKPDFLQ